jgi:hypothetical protein
MWTFIGILFALLVGSLIQWGTGWVDKILGPRRG